MGADFRAGNFGEHGVFGEGGAAHEVVNGGPVALQGEPGGPVGHHAFALSAADGGAQVGLGGLAKDAAGGRALRGVAGNHVVAHLANERREEEKKAQTQRTTNRVQGYRGNGQPLQRDEEYRGGRRTEEYVDVAWQSNPASFSFVRFKFSLHLKAAVHSITLREVTPGPTASTMAPASWPRIDGKRPSGSCPPHVYTSVWHSALATTFTRTSPNLGAATTIYPVFENKPQDDEDK